MVTLCMCILGTFLRKFWSILRARDILTICEERIDENFPIVLFFPDDERLPLTSQERFVSTEFNQYDVKKKQTAKAKMTTKDTLKKNFGYDSFREGQEEVINEILKGRDVLAIMPTGAGKSLCYEIPALMMDGITIIISPLISLMQDQVTALKDLGITATYINSLFSDFEIGKVFNDINNDKYKNYYVST